LVIAEDGNTANHLISWSDRFGAQAIARNQIVLEQSSLGGNVYAEMTGPTFTPNGSLLFANVQEPGDIRDSGSVGKVPRLKYSGLRTAG
jgi:secreted PhoX family phosphatase